MNNGVLFSFVIPVYGTEKYLRRCLDSVFAQTAQNYEVIVVDDGSPGDCERIAAEYDVRVRYVRHETNRSLLQARLTGLRLAEGKYVIPVDSDDCVHPELTARLAATADRLNRPDVIEYGVMAGDDYYFKNKPVESCSGAEAFQSVCRAERSWNVCGKAVRTEVYRNAVGRAEFADLYLNMGEDLLQTVAVLLSATVCAYCDYPGYGYMANGDSITQAEKASFEKCRKRVEASALCLRRCEQVIRARVPESDPVGLLATIRQRMIEWDLGSSYELAGEERDKLVAFMCEAYGDPLSVISGFHAVIDREKDGSAKWWQEKFEKTSEELWHAQQRAKWLEDRLNAKPKADGSGDSSGWRVLVRRLATAFMRKRGG